MWKPLVAALMLAGPLGARVMTLDIDGAIHPVTTEIVRSAVDTAEREHDAALVIRLSTPGGLMDATRDIVEIFLRSRVPVIVWVGPSGARAASAGFFLLESADIAAMAPGTNTGASHPVTMSGEPLDPVMKQKVENDAAAFMRGIAARRGRNVEAAEKTVRDSSSYTDREALDKQLIDVIAPDEKALLAALDGREIARFDGRRVTLHLRNEQTAPYPLSPRQRILGAIADPNIALLLLVLGALGVYAEFSHPGLIVPGVAGAILVLLGLSALALFPIDWLGAALMLLGLVFFVLEAKFATHGLLTAGGAVALVAGSLLLIDTNVPELRIHWGAALAITVPFALITSFLLSIAVHARRNKVVTGSDAMIGETATAVGALNPSLKPAGKVMVRGEYWNAESRTLVAPSEQVRIVGVSGLTLKVEPVAPKGTE